jgi:hypothetical protein
MWKQVNPSNRVPNPKMLVPKYDCAQFVPCLLQNAPYPNKSFEIDRKVFPTRAILPANPHINSRCRLLSALVPCRLRDHSGNQCPACVLPRRTRRCNSYCLGRPGKYKSGARISSLFRWPFWFLLVTRFLTLSRDPFPENSFDLDPVKYDACCAGNVSNNSNRRIIQMEDWPSRRMRNFYLRNLLHVTKH